MRYKWHKLNILLQYYVRKGGFRFYVTFFNIGTALNQLGEITNALREKTRLAGSNEHNRKQYQEYQNTIASQNAGMIINIDC